MQTATTAVARETVIETETTLIEYNTNCIVLILGLKEKGEKMMSIEQGWCNPLISLLINLYRINIGRLLEVDYKTEKHKLKLVLLGTTEPN